MEKVQIIYQLVENVATTALHENKKNKTMFNVIH